MVIWLLPLIQRRFATAHCRFIYIQTGDDRHFQKLLGFPLKYQFMNMKLVHFIKHSAKNLGLFALLWCNISAVAVISFLILESKMSIELSLVKYFMRLIDICL